MLFVKSFFVAGGSTRKALYLRYPTPSGGSKRRDCDKLRSSNRTELPFAQLKKKQNKNKLKFEVQDKNVTVVYLKIPCKSCSSFHLPMHRPLFFY